MLDPVAAVARAVRQPRHLIAVDRLPHRPVADGMDGDLQAPPVDLGTDRLEPLRLEQRRARSRWFPNGR